MRSASAGGHLWKALDALTANFAPIGKPTYEASFKFAIQQTCHQITVAVTSEAAARAIALTVARRNWSLLPLNVLNHQRVAEGGHVTAVEGLPPPPPNDFILPIMS